MALSLSEMAVLLRLALQNRDVRAMRKINDRCIKETAMRFSRPAYNFALISYVLGKMLSKPRYISQKKVSESFSAICHLFLSCEKAAHFMDGSQLLSQQERILFAIERIDEQDQRFAKSIITKGRLKMASTLYAQGISLGSAVQMSGTDKRELLSYAGQTMMFDRIIEKKSMQQRMREIREIFSE